MKKNPLTTILIIVSIIILFILSFIWWQYKKTDNKIDLVYTWVDGSDPNWIRNKNKFLEISKTKINDNEKSNKRFINTNELKYSLRGVYKYLPWVNKIYIVVADGQIPQWLNINHPKIQLIKHSQIFPNKEDLPTFNSHAIECHLHRIPNLTENYIYINDDVFIGDYINKNEFINSNNKLSYFTSNHKCNFNENHAKQSAYYGAWYKTKKLLYNKFKLNPNCQNHYGIILKKSNFTNVKKIFPNEFKSTSSSKFRDSDNIVPNGLAYQFGLYNNDYIMNNDIKGIMTGNNDPKILNNITKNKPKMFCINNNNKYNPSLIKFLESYYPEKSPFEI